MFNIKEIEIVDIMNCDAKHNIIMHLFTSKKRYCKWHPGFKCGAFTEVIKHDVQY